MSLRGIRTHGDVSDVWVDIGLPHGIRQPQPGYPRALLGLDAVEHLVSRGSPASEPRLESSSVLTVHAPARALHLREPSVPVMGCSCRITAL